MIKGYGATFPYVEVMILNHNGQDHLDRCIASLAQTNYPAFSIILIDNNSCDGSLDLVRDKHPGVTVIENKQNLGFGRAYDMAIRSSNAKFIALLNNDTLVDPNWLTPLVKSMLADDNLAAASAKLLFMEHPQVINHAGGGMNFIGLGYDRSMFEPDDLRDSRSLDVFFPSGAACLMRKSAYIKSGGFDPAFFMYHEDVDLGWRLQLYGYRVMCIPGSRVYHAFGGSTLKSAGMSFRNNLGYRHAMRSLIKNYNLPGLATTLPLFLVLGLRAFFRDRSIHFFQCLFWNLYYLPSTLKHRREVQRNRVKTDAQIAHLIWPYLQLPVYYPDYSILTLEAFTASGDKSGVADMVGGLPALGYGWHAPDHLESPRTSYRWTRKKAVLYLWKTHGPVIICMQILGMAQSLGRSRRFSLYINDDLAETLVLDSDGIEFFEVRHSGPEGPMELRVECADTWKPHDQYTNGDHRELGIGVVRAAVGSAALDKRPYAGISLIIPTHNRIQSLQQVLSALENQTLPKDFFEVIVVDDGSTDSTASVLEEYTGKTSMRLLCVTQANRKQGAARNNGLNHATMPLAAFIGDDIIPAPYFLEAHLRRHNQENINDKLGVIGHTKWSQNLKVTPFMEYIHECGYQFGFSIMDNINDLPFNFFYTSNISLPRAFLQSQEVIFDEDFASYGWEDIELGHRLNSQGMRLCFEHKAVAFHDHPTDVRLFCRRQFNVGRTSRLFLKKHPDLQCLLGGEELRKQTGYRSVAKILAVLLNIMDRMHIRLPHRVYGFLLHTFYCLGTQDGRT